MRDARPFVTWGADHLAVLALTAVGAAALLGCAGRLRRVDDRRVRRTAAAVLLLNELAALFLAARQGTPRVPLQLCDLALFCAVWALYGAPPAVRELAYFWGLAGSLQALLTPDLRHGFPDYWWAKFFITHSGVVLTAVFLGVSGRVSPSPRAIWKIWGLTNLYAAIAGLVNWVWGTNFGYLASKPSQPSVLDHLGPWPYYILSMEGVALISMALCYAPFAFRRQGGQALQGSS